MILKKPLIVFARLKDKIITFLTEQSGKKVMLNVASIDSLVFNKMTQ